MLKPFCGAEINCFSAVCFIRSPLGVTVCAFLSLRQNVLPLTLSHRATEQRRYSTKRKRFYSQFFPLFSTEER